MQKMRIFQLLLILTVLASSVSQGELRAEPQENALQTYQFEHLDLKKTEMELANLNTQFGFIKTDLIQSRQTILANKKSSIEYKKSSLNYSATIARNKISSAFRSFIFEPFYQDQNWEQAKTRIPKYSSVYKAWFKALEASHHAEVELFETYYLTSENAYANKALTRILESGNAKNIVILAKQARLNFITGNAQAARQILAQIELRKKSESAEALYLPDFATFIWTPAELKAQLKSAMQQYQTEVKRLKKWT